ncbi:MAG: hypothetical protein HYV28_06945 [Ignavibacteriales bacterium]|nr:hypothetical protein [Ignavibacteriales bacterium]
MVKYEGGAGTSIREAIKIIGAQNDREGVDAEYRFLARIFSVIRLHFTVLFQELFRNKDGYYDRLVLMDENGKISEIWFDITECYGKW